jgi:hypothetical protein
MSGGRKFQMKVGGQEQVGLRPASNKSSFWAFSALCFSSGFSVGYLVQHKRV